MKLYEMTQSGSIIKICVDSTDASSFVSEFYGLGDMTNVFQRLMVSSSKYLLSTICYLKEIPMASIGLFTTGNQSQ